MDLSEPFVKQTIGSFFKEWLSVSDPDIEIKEFTNGFCNTVALVQRTDSLSNGVLHHPVKVIFRLYGGNVYWKTKVSQSNDSVFTNFFVHKNNPLEETIIVYQLSKKGYGPKLYGIFNGGRLDEYIPSHTLKHEELQDENIIRDLAINYARLHSIKVPLQNKIHIVDQRIRSKLVASDEEYSVMAARHFTPQVVQTLTSLGIDVAKLQSFDYKNEWTWIMGMRKQIKSRKVMSSYDCNFLNVLVRDDEVPDGESRIVLIDHEATLVGYRSQNIGCHFMNWMLKWKSRTDKRSGLDYPCEQKRRTFITSYLMEQKRLSYIPDFDENGFDSVDKVMLEADFGLLNSILYCTFGLIAEIPGFVVDDPSFLRAVIFLQDFYMEFKQQSILKHGW